MVSKGTKTAIITGASGLGGAIPGAVIGVIGGNEYYKRNKGLFSLAVAYKVILPVCITTTMVVSGAIGYYLAESIPEEKKA